MTHRSAKIQWLQKGLMVLLAISSSPRVWAATDPAEDRYALQWVGSGFFPDPALGPPVNVPIWVPARATDGSLHAIVILQQADQSLALYYSNNRAGTDEQGLIPPERVSVQSEPISPEIRVDALDTAHIVWRSKQEVEDEFGTLDTFNRTINDLWYRARNPSTGSWSAEQRLTDYRSEVTMYAQDGEKCTSYPPEDPPHGRQWWARPQIVSQVMGIEPTG